MQLKALKKLHNFSVCLALLFLAVFVSAFSCPGKDAKSRLSDALHFNEIGWNKLICFKNGNTLLFHFEPAKRILVKVFDSAGHEIASHRDAHYKILSDYNMRTVVFKGLLDINNEAVLFLEQEINGKHDLIMLRYSATSGELQEERLIGASEGPNKRVQYFVMKDKKESGYSILFCRDNQLSKSTALSIVYFNEQNKSVREVKIPIDREKYDYLDVLGAESSNGEFVTVGVGKKVIYGTGEHTEPINPKESIYDHRLLCYYIAPDQNNVKSAELDLATSPTPYYTLTVPNALTKSHNVLLYNYRPIYEDQGINVIKGSYSSSIFCTLNDSNFRINYKRLKNEKANSFLRSQGRTNAYYDGIPIVLYANGGIVSLISESITADSVEQIGITKLDTAGNEIFGTLLPFRQYGTGYNTSRGQAKHWQSENIFNEFGDFSDRQFLSFAACFSESNIFIVCNDYKMNFNSSIMNPGKVVYSSYNTTACYYKIDSEGNSVKKYLFGQPNNEENTATSTGSAYFDESRSRYVSIVKKTKDKDVSFYVCWTELK